MGKGHVRRQPPAEKGADASLRPIEELIRDDDVGGLVLADRMYSTPSSFIPKMLARKFNSDGSNRWPAPWRARNATRRPRNVPTT
jgi:hypothetical protein